MARLADTILTTGQFPAMKCMVILLICVPLLQGCDPGKWGDSCDRNCSDHCRLENNSCINTTGKCVNGCDDGYKGDRCDTECDQGKYGKKCQQNCSANCKNKDCNYVTGNCKECKDGKYGPNCTKLCSTHCKGTHNVCDQNSGDCKEGCVDGFKTPECKDCIAGKYGEDCGKPCVEDCLDKPCDRKTGKCIASGGAAYCQISNILKIASLGLIFVKASGTLTLTIWA